MSTKEWTVEGLEGVSLMSPVERDAIVAACRPGMRVLEIGTYHGVTAADIARRCPETYFICLDTFVDSASQTSLWHKNAQPNMQLRTHAASKLPICNSDPPFDIIIIDGGHTYEAAYEDCQATRRLIHPDGAIFVHDYTCRCFPGIRRACCLDLELHGWVLAELVGTLARFRQAGDNEQFWN